MTRKQIREAKRQARRALRKKMSFIIPSLIRTVSIVSTVVTLYLLASDLSFDADHSGVFGNYWSWIIRPMVWYLFLGPGDIRATNVTVIPIH